MTIRQHLLKLIYPLFRQWTNRAAGEQAMLAGKDVKPPVSFYSLNDITITGKPFDFSALKGKKVMLVNTASDCGYTGQYAELEKLYKQYYGKLEILGFPANDFKEQEKGTDEEIATFCRVNFGITFPLMHKTSVVKGPEQNSVFKWLSDPAENGWNKRRPVWNFSKYLVNENGELVNYFGPSISPLDDVVIKAITK